MAEQEQNAPQGAPQISRVIEVCASEFDSLDGILDRLEITRGSDLEYTSRLTVAGEDDFYAAVMIFE
jgi:hypothetical protein